MTRTVLRIFALAFLAAFLLFFENMHLVGIALGGIFTNTAVLASIDLLAVVLCAIASIRPIVTGVKNIWEGRVLPEFFLAISFVLFFLYGNILYILRIEEPRFIGFAIAVFALVSALSDYGRIKADFSAFRLLASAGDKLAASVSETRTSVSETDALADLSAGENTRLISMKKIDFATGFTARTSCRCENSVRNLILLIAASVLSLTASVVTGILMQSVADAFVALCLSFVCILPSGLLLLHTLPFATLSRRTQKQHSVVVGEVSAHEYCDADAIAFEDVEAFSARNVRVQQIKLYGADTALDRVLYQVAAAFSVVGGPLDGVFRSSTAELGLASDTALLRAGEGGFVAAVEGHEIMLGRGEYMLENGVRMYYDADDERQIAGGKVNIMFAADNGKLTAKFYIRYKMDEEFERNVELLHRKGMRTVLRTYDPNIRAEMIEKISYVSRFDIRVVRKTVVQLGDFATERQNSGIVTRGSTQNVVATVLLCRRTAKLIRILSAVGFGIAAVGVALASVLAAFGILPALDSLWFGAYQALVCLPLLITTKLYIGK